MRSRQKARPAQMAETLIRLRGRVKMELHGPDGELKHSHEADNLITTVGKQDIVDQLLASPGQAKPQYMAVGTGSTAAAIGDTALGTESARVALATKTRSTNVLTMTATFPAGTGTAALTEAGVFSAVSVGDLYSRVVFSAINKGAADSLTITWTYTLS
jgi:hypothetical protein